MRTRIFDGLLPFAIVLICGIALIPLGATGQWTNLAPKLLGADGEFGAIAFKNGVAWAGLNEVYLSLDSGKTWTIVDLVLSNGEQVTDIACFDARTAIVTTTGGAHLTQDQGATFTHFFKGYQFRSATFGKNSNEFAIVDAVPDHVLATADGGANWNDYMPSANGMMLRAFADGTLASLNGDITGDQISLSSDFGKTWIRQTASVDFDCYNFVVDPCNDSALYVMNEQVYQLSDHTAKVYSSTNRGASWNTSAGQPVPFYSGSMAITPVAFYLGTTAGGILRSTDKGNTWMTIGGPRSAADSRSIAAIDENKLLAISPDDGSIWVTPNSGGSKVYAWQGATPIGVLNSFDGTLNTFCNAIDTQLYIVGASCTSIGGVTLLSDSIVGSTNFVVRDARALPRLLGQFDSIAIHYSSNGPTLDTGLLHLRYKIGATVRDTTIFLIQNGDSPRAAISNSVGTLHVHVNDPVDVPIGATVAPLLKIGLRKIDSITFILKYNANVIDMIPSKAKTLITPRAGWTVSNAVVGNGDLTVTMVNTIHETLTADSLYLATARFTSFQSTSKSTTVLFGELDLYSDTNAIALCTGSEGDFIANITVDNAGVLLARSPVESISVRPNPVRNGEVLNVRLSLNAPAWVTISIVDILGKDVFQSVRRVSAGICEFPIHASLLEGSYYLRIEASGVVSARKIVVR